MERFIFYKEFIKKRHQRQLEFTKKKGRFCINQYEVGGRVTIQDNISGMCNVHGKVTGKRETEECTFRSFINESDSERELLGNAKFLKHE